MKKRIYLLVCCLIALFISSFIYATDPYSKNLGFETGTFTGWTGYNWLYSTDVPSINTSPSLVSLPTSRRQVIMTDTTAYDAKTGNALKIIPKGYKYSARLGDITKTGDPNPRCWEQSLRYTLKVDSTNALLLMKFACVLEYASDHTALMEPRFKLTLYDQSGSSINSCSNYDVYSTSTTAKGFQSYTPAGSSNPVKWRDWTSVGANLLSYIGQTITIEFMAADCTGRYHYGYAYFVAESHPMYITVKYCSGDVNATLSAPEGFETYSWVDSNGTIVGTSQTLVIQSPVEGAVYTCNLVSATGCAVSLSSTIAKYEPNADFKYELVDCNNLTNTIKFTNSYPAKHGTLGYNWNFGDGSTSTEQSPTHVFKTSGMHPVSLLVTNPPSLCTDSVTKMVETFYPPLIGISGDSTYCPGSTTTLKAHGAYRYLWSNGSTADSIQVGNDTTVWMIGYSSVGCYTDTIRFKVKEEPDWTFNTSGNELYCQGDSTVLSATGAAKYKWSTGSADSSIVVKTSGVYTIVGSNARGCEKSTTFNVVEDPLPNASFSVSTNSINVRQNKLTCTLPEESGVQYSWNMGDGLTETGSTIQHSYNIISGTLEYIVALTATNKNGCVNTSSQNIEVVPFIPNVFSPNGDGVNDTFMSGYDLQVFDRNGILLYKGTSGWNGIYENKKMDNDTYFYLLHYTDKNQQIQTRKGYVTLKR
jgi:gliding motility-associated-like protein